VVLAVVVVVVAIAGTVVGVGWFARSRPANTAVADQKPRISPLSVVSLTPGNGTASVDTAAPIVVDLSSPLAPGSPMPTITPSVNGYWSVPSPTELRFVALVPMTPGTHETLTVPGGPDGLVDAQHQHLAAAVTSNFTVAAGSMLRLQQLLAELGYMPVSFAPAAPLANPSQQADVQQGTFAWRWPTAQATLGAEWSEGQPNVISTGAVMTFEQEHGLGSDGVAGPQVWSALLQAAGEGTANSQPYNFVLVNQNRPQSTTVFSNGAAAYSSPANTGVSGATTVDGTFPVYLRYQVTTMTGTNPDGSHYSDPGIPWVSYFNGGDALHGFVRPGYGYPQSDGCVEMPPANAAVVWPMTPIGTLVTVVGPPGS
jgi:hypothetical protein